jgi:hypothetical protein
VIIITTWNDPGESTDVITDAISSIGQSASGGFDKNDGNFPDLKKWLYVLLVDI